MYKDAALVAALTAPLSYYLDPSEIVLPILFAYCNALSLLMFLRSEIPYYVRYFCETK